MALQGGATVSVFVLRAMVSAIGRGGADTQAFLAALGLSPEALAAEDGRVRSSVIHDAWREGERLTNDPSLGLHAAQHLRMGDLDVLDYVCRSSRSLGECFVHVERYIRVLHDAAVVRLTVDGADATVTYRGLASPGGVLRHGAEYIVAAFVLRGRAFTRSNWAPREVWFQHPAPDDESEYRKVFGCPVYFRRESNAILLDRALLDTPVPTADGALHAVLARHANELLARVPESSTVADQVRRLLPEALRLGTTQVTDLAGQLHLTPRSLQRRLSEEGTSFQQLLDETRRELALRYVHVRGMTIAELAFLLGFADASSFIRAFKRWTGDAPSDYRRRTT
jgi:AraC-like DNA-binding protein